MDLERLEPVLVAVEELLTPLGHAERVVLLQALFAGQPPEVVNGFALTSGRALLEDLNRLAVAMRPAGWFS